MMGPASALATPARAVTSNAVAASVAHAVAAVVAVAVAVG